MRIVAALILSIFTTTLYGQVHNGLIDNSLTNFKCNFYLDELDLYSYYFFIDYLENNYDEYYLFDEKYNGNIKTITTKVYTKAIDEDNLAGIRFEKFNAKNQKLYLKDDEKGKANETTVKETFYKYNNNNKLKQIKKVLNYKSRTIVEKETEYFKFLNYNDSILVNYKTDFYKKVAYDPDFNEDSHGEYEKKLKFYLKNDSIIKLEIYDDLFNVDSEKTITYHNNGYEIDKSNYAGGTNFLVQYNKDKNEVNIKNREASLKVNNVTKYTFDKHDNIKSVTQDSYRMDGKFVKEPIHRKEQSIKYKYDKHNNWISKEVKNEIRNTTVIFIRTIEYIN